MKSQSRRCARLFGAPAMVAIILATAPAPNANAQISLPPVSGPIDSTVDPLLRRTDELDNRARRRVEKAQETVDELPATTDELLEPVDEVLAAGGDLAAGAVDSLLRVFVPDTDVAGQLIEKNVLVLLLNDEELQLLAYGGFDIISQRTLSSMGLTMVTLRDPRGFALSQTAGNLRQAFPDGAVDYNHIYQLADDDAADASNESTGENSGVSGNGPSLRIGMIDSAIAIEHFSLGDSDVRTADFVSLDGTRPVGHGTAVASLIARSSGNRAQILAASVFFQAPNHAPGASTESLIAALDWLSSENVDVINMSLSGPSNALLERALLELAKAGPPVVAAVGNNGPSGEPLYPAAYDKVIGVTATDRDKKIYRYANRGPHVDFAALGVNVKVADAGGGWRVESGTSMASPIIAVVVARTLQSNDLGTAALVEMLGSSAEDLGRKGFDPVFGYGLITEPPLLLSGN